MERKRKPWQNAALLRAAQRAAQGLALLLAALLFALADPQLGRNLCVLWSKQPPPLPSSSPLILGRAGVLSR